MNIKKVALVAAAFTLCVSAIATIDIHKNHVDGVLKARQEYNKMLLTFMTGGLSSVEARCILETRTPEEIAPCVKASTPVKGREL